MNTERGRPTARDSTSVSELIFDSTNESSDELGSAQEDWRRYVDDGEDNASAAGLERTAIRG